MPSHVWDFTDGVRGAVAASRNYDDLQIPPFPSSPPSGDRTDGQLTLGQFIDRLATANSTAYVRYDFGDLVPTTFDSYRGYYEQLALGYQIGGQITVADLLARARQALTLPFFGYKGGHYRMSFGTPLWAANWGCTSPTVITDVRSSGSEAVIVTATEMPT